MSLYVVDVDQARYVKYRSHTARIPQRTELTVTDEMVLQRLYQALDEVLRSFGPI